MDVFAVVFAFSSHYTNDNSFELRAFILKLFTKSREGILQGRRMLVKKVGK